MKNLKNKTYKKILRSLLFKLLIFSLIVITSCSQYYIPVKTENMRQIDNFSVIESNNIVYAVSLKNWFHNPEEITNYYFPIFITINNQSSKKIVIKRDDIILLDENKNQFDCVSKDELLETIDEAFSNDLIIDKYDIANLERKNNRQQKKIEGKNNILRYSFHFGNIAPGAKKSGFVFFPEISSKNNKIFLYIKNQKFTYTKYKK